MKHVALHTLLFFLFLTNLSAQDSIRHLEVIGKVWGSCYMLHPSVVRKNPSLNWERSLVRFLDRHDSFDDQRDLSERLNKDLLSDLRDPLTWIKQGREVVGADTCQFVYQEHAGYDYVRLPASFLSRKDNWLVLDSALTHRYGRKPLVLDIRFYRALEACSGPGEKDAFDYICGMLTPGNLGLGALVSRYHYGWDEMNDLPPFRQEWKVIDSGILHTLASFPYKSRHPYPQKDFARSITIERPVYLLINRTTLSYYKHRLKTLREHRPNVHVLWEQTGRIYDNATSIHFQPAGMDFYLNPTLHLTERIGFRWDYESDKPIDRKNLDDILQTKIFGGAEHDFSFQITPRLYPTTIRPLSRSYKLLGLFKLWSVLTYMYPAGNPGVDTWQGKLPAYIRKVTGSRSDAEYFSVLRSMLDKLNNDQLILNQSNLFDFVNEFVVPVRFSMVQDQLVVTQASGMPDHSMLRAGDRILRIEGRTVDQILTEASKIFFPDKANRLANLALNRYHFRGRAGSMLHMTVAGDKGIRGVKISRTMHVSDTREVGASSPDLPRDIEYLHPGGQWKDSCWQQLSFHQGMIIDLRNSSLPGGYPSMLERSILTPVVSASEPAFRTHQVCTRPAARDSLPKVNQPVAVLIDPGSRGNTCLLAHELSLLERVFLVGEPTSSLPPGMTRISLPGDVKVLFPGEKIQPGDNDPSGDQRVVPDIHVKRTLSGISGGTDEVLQRAVEEIQKRRKEKDFDPPQ